MYKYVSYVQYMFLLINRNRKGRVISYRILMIRLLLYVQGIKQVTLQIIFEINQLDIPKIGQCLFVLARGHRTRVFLPCIAAACAKLRHAVPTQYV